MMNEIKFNSEYDLISLNFCFFFFLSERQIIISAFTYYDVMHS